MMEIVIKHLRKFTSFIKKLHGRNKIIVIKIIVINFNLILVIIFLYRCDYEIPKRL